jgi:hypothetical protein
MLLTNELATGEFGWIIPDDDITRPDALQRVLSVLKTHPEVDYVFVNVSVRRPADRHAFSRPAIGADFPELLPAKGKSLTDRYVEQWEELIDPDVDDVFLGSVMCSVFKLSLWRNHRPRMIATDKIYSSLEQTYPHSVILAYTMHGRPAYYIGYPCVITFWGEQEWISYVPMIVLVRLQELLDLYQQLGVARWRVERCRRFLLSYSVGALKAMLMDPKTPGREYFSLHLFFGRNRHHPRELCRIVTLILYSFILKKMVWTIQQWMSQRLPKPVYQALRTVKRNMVRLLSHG